MPWYYVKLGQRVGPIEQSEFDALSQNGEVLADTLVWKSGMKNWVKYSELVGPPSFPTEPPPVVQESSPQSPANLLLGVDAPEATLESPEVALTSEVRTQPCSECGRAFPADELIQFEKTLICRNCKPIVFQRARPVSGATVAKPAGFWIRGSALLIDGLILTAAQWLVAISVVVPFMLGGGDLQALGASPIVKVAESLLGLVIGVAYSTILLGRYGATVGKLAVGIQVVNENGSKMSYGKAFGRHFAPIFSALPLLAGYWIVAFDDQKRTFHDRICGTRVVYKVRTGRF